MKYDGFGSKIEYPTLNVAYLKDIINSLKYRKAVKITYK